MPFWAKGVPPKLSTINARVETVATAASYRGPWKRGQRCILPATGFYEWQLRESGKQPFYIFLTEQSLFGFAGLWDASTNTDGEVLESCTILTMPANPLMAEIHNVKARMPAILRRDDHDAWLSGDADTAMNCITAYPQELMRAYPVSTVVNSPRNNELRLIEPLAVAPARQESCAKAAAPMYSGVSRTAAARAMPRSGMGLPLVRLAGLPHAAADGFARSGGLIVSV